jgi:hypothetical protein
MDDVSYNVGGSRVPNTLSFPATNGTRTVTELFEETTRIEYMIEKVSEMLEMPGLDLASAMRLNMHRLELVAYLKGVQYGGGGRPEYADLAPLTAK